MKCDMELVQKIKEKELIRSGEKVNIKVIAATIVATFLIGRVVMFTNTFPCAIALITVMMSVNTVNIYLVPVMWLSMMTYYQQQLHSWGDMAAIIVCGLLFLFLNNVKLNINQRTAIACAVTIVANCLYYVINNITYLFQVETIIKEVILVAVFVKIFHIVAEIVFNGVKDKKIEKVSTDKIVLSFAATAILAIAGVGVYQVILLLWLLLIMFIQADGNISNTILAAATIGVVGFCIGITENIETMAICLLIGVLAGEFAATFVTEQYRKTVIGVSICAVYFAQSTADIYVVAIATAIFLAIPSSILAVAAMTIKNRIIPTEVTDADIKLERVKEKLAVQKENFNSLGQLYGVARDSRQIISYQFLGMEKVVDKILANIDNGKTTSLTRSNNINIDKLQIHTGGANYAFEGVSGDSSLCTILSDGKIAMILSDGMGKGQDASNESKLVVTTLGKLLEAGFDVDLAMRTINGILLTKDQSEIFSTVDLALINPQTGRTKLFKMGAATTFIKRGNKVDMVKVPALPIGITDGLKLEYQDVKLKRGDLFIMVSDGVTDCDRGDPSCNWLQERIGQMTSKDPDTVSELIVNKAAEKYQLRERDDLTVLVASIG
ncbi:MAG: SpoIIE family protein phosphatase [Anaerovoracaceae bacterium]